MNACALAPMDEDAFGDRGERRTPSLSDADDLDDGREFGIVANIPLDGVPGSYPTGQTPHETELRTFPRTCTEAGNVSRRRLVSLLPFQRILWSA